MTLKSRLNVFAERLARFIADEANHPLYLSAGDGRHVLHGLVSDLRSEASQIEEPEDGPPGSRAWVAGVLETVFAECRALRVAGQKEYAHAEDNAFANFESDTELGVSREVSLAVFANKHWRGIRAWVAGHRSQREDVRGRINDLIVYLVLLRAMADQDALRAKGGAP